MQTYRASDGTVYEIDDDGLAALPKDPDTGPVLGMEYRDGDAHGLLVDVTISRESSDYGLAGRIWREVYEHLCGLA